MKNVRTRVSLVTLYQPEPRRKVAAEEATSARAEACDPPPMQRPRHVRVALVETGRVESAKDGDEGDSEGPLERERCGRQIERWRDKAAKRRRSDHRDQDDRRSAVMLACRWAIREWRPLGCPAVPSYCPVFPSIAGSLPPPRCLRRVSASLRLGLRGPSRWWQGANGHQRER